MNKVLKLFGSEGGGGGEILITEPNFHIIILMYNKCLTCYDVVKDVQKDKLVLHKIFTQKWQQKT